VEKKAKRHNVMNPERRDSARLSVDLRVHIRYRKRRLHSAHVRNLSTHGMLLDIQSVTLPTGTLVELELDNGSKELRIPATVIHHEGSGIEVMFRYPQPELFETLREINRKPFPEARSQFAATTQAHPA
jgi:hypothetical protein